jgi:hypothetical protein
MISVDFRLFHLQATKIFFCLSCLFLSLNSQAQDDDEVMQYIETYKKLAVDEQVRTGVPAAITLAQGIHESAVGKSELATKGNNHFGIKCKTTWTGETILHDDDAKQECFRKYSSAEQSYLDHSNFLRAGSRYAFLFDLDVTDYKGWASGLKRAGYATNPLYVKRLTDLVEKYNLQQFTYEAQTKVFATVGERVPDGDATTMTRRDDPAFNTYKGLKGFWAKRGDMLLDRAMEWNIRYPRLLVLNELNDAPLEYDMFVFTEKKRKTGTEEFHIVKAGETMHMIAQKEAILLENLYLFNNLTEGQEPETGEKLALQYKAYDTPKLKPKFLNTLAENRPVKPAVQPIENKATEAPVRIEPKVEEPVKEVERPAVVAVEKQNSENPVVEVSTPVVVEVVAPMPEKVKPEEPQIQAIKTETAPAVIPVKETIVIDTPKPAEPVAIVPTMPENPDIIDPEKARKVELLLEGRSNIPEPVKTQEKQVSISYGQAPAVVPAEKPIPEPVKPIEPEMPKRTYNEAGVSDSVKALKQKFDPVVYKPLPPRQAKKVITAPVNTPTVGVKPPAQETKTQQKSTPAAETKEGKNAQVKVTKTGIERQPKKAETAKEKTTSAKNTSKKAIEKPGAKKESSSKGNAKKDKTSSAKNAGKESKGKSTSKDASKTKGNPKDAKSKSSVKKK